MTHEVNSPVSFELLLTRLIGAPREKLFRAWTDPALIVQWFTPAPWKTLRAEVDLRPGGSSLIVMQNPEGQEFPSPGVYLEVVKNEKLVFTDAYTRAWEPAEKPSMTGILTLLTKTARRATPRACGTGGARTTTRTSAWAFTRAGARRPTNSKRSWRASDRRVAMWKSRTIIVVKASRPR